MAIEKIPLGCIGNKQKEFKRNLSEIIKDHVDEDTIFVEPFCGSSVVSYNVFKQFHVKTFHINDLDKIRIEFFNDVLDEKKLKELYDIEESINEKGETEYYKHVDKKQLKTDYWSYVIGRRICSFRYGLFPTTKKLSITRISDKWIEFLKLATKTNEDWKTIVDIYKDNENAFVYLDPPYLDSYNASYNNYDKAYDEEANVIDNTKIYIDILDYLKKCKCKILFSINKNAITEYLYKDYIKENYNRTYDLRVSRKSVNETFSSKKSDVYIISNF